MAHGLCNNLQSASVHSPTLSTVRKYGVTYDVFYSKVRKDKNRT